MTATQTRAADPGQETEILGSAVSAVVDGAGALAPAYGDRATDILGEYGIHEPSREGWYDADRFRRVLGHIAETAGPATVRRIGREMATRMELPDVTDTGEALAGLDGAYRQLHRGTAGAYEVEDTGERSTRVRARTPYPEAFDRGLLRGVGYAFSEGVPRVTVVESDENATVYDVTW